MKSAESIKKTIEQLLIFFLDLLKWIFYLFAEWFFDLQKFFKKHWHKDKNRVNRLSVIITFLLIWFYLIYWAIWLYKDFTKRLHKDYYEEVLFTNYETEIKSFFDKYNERYKAKDCNFMREVWADEAMYDKFWRTSYWNDYPCDWFIYTPTKIIIPIKIEPIEKTDNKYRVKWEIITLTKDSQWQYFIGLSNVELRKLLDWNLRHFTWNPKWLWPSKINFEKL